MRLYVLALLGLMSSALGACSATSDAVPPGGAGGAGAQSGAGGTASGSGGFSAAGGTSPGSGGTGGLGIGGFGGGGGAAQGPPIIYANTDTTLFKLDPTTFALTRIGDFDCIGGANPDGAMTDFAVDKSLALWGISVSAVHPLSVQGGAVHCGAPIQLNNASGIRFYGLTFAPAGVLDPTKEVLVASNSGGQLWAIDGQGNLTQHGTFGRVPATDGNGHSYRNAGQLWELSGDIVFLANSGNPIGFATVRDCPNPPSTRNCDSVNTLIEINVPALKTATTGSVTQSVRGEILPAANCQNPSSGNFGNMYGIAALNDKVYGFSRSGNIVEINTADGTACLIKDYSNDPWAGAGVTTLAPVRPPPPK